MVANPQWQTPWQGGPMSVSEYLQLDRSTPDAKYEYLDGIARLMSGGSVEHDRISRNAVKSLEENFLTGPCTVFGSDMQVLVGLKSNGKENYFYPDATLSCDVADRRRGNKLIRSPRLVVEVLSPSTERDDRGKKLKAYQACPTIHEILLISQFAPHVEVYERDSEDETIWHLHPYGPGEEIRLDGLDICIPLDDLYKGINFDEPLLEE